MTNITVLKDESLGGIEREYREVKRKADVGERIVFDSDRPGITEGKPYNVRGGDHDGAEFVDDNGTGRWQSHVRANCYVLEPTDILRINGERFRMVDRKAAVGERVIITEIVDYAMADMTVGRSYVVVGTQSNFSEPPYVNVIDDAGDRASADQRGYRVLEPVETAEPTPLLSDKPAPDQAAEIIAKLTTRVDALEKRVAALETPKSRPATDEEVADVIAKLSRAKSPQEIRDDIVKRAKEDVERHKITHHPTLAQFYRREWLELTAEFIVNCEKRTVVCLLRERNVKARVRYRGIAKCAPGDVFNSHIGRAISLRRALGLTVLAEYFEAPNPTEVRVGDVIDYGDGRGSLRVFPDNGDLLSDTTYLSTAVDHIHRVVFIDDSREVDSAEPWKEVA